MRINQRFLANKRSILALLAVLALMAMLATQAVWAQEEEDEPCSKDGDVVKCTYAENDTDPVVRIFATSPERDEVDFSVEGLDAADFTVDGGVLRFDRNLPTTRSRRTGRAIDDADTPDVDEVEAGDNNVYLVTVRSTDVRPAGTAGAAPTSTVDVVVTVTNLDEPGTAVISLRQPEAGTLNWKPVARPILTRSRATLLTSGPSPRSAGPGLRTMPTGKTPKAVPATAA